MHDLELRDRYAMIGEDLLRQGLVAREDKPARIAPRVRNAQQLEVAHDVLVELPEIEERLQEIEHDVWLPLLYFTANRRELVVHLERPRLVAECAEGGEDVDLGLVVVPFLVRQRFE